MTPSRAFFTSGVSVLIFMPGPAGIAHEATGFGLFSTCEARTGYMRICVQRANNQAVITSELPFLALQSHSGVLSMLVYTSH